MFDVGQTAQQSPDRGLTKGWLIELSRVENDSGKTDASRRRFLQIGTGQWCGAEYATLFPLRRTAVSYAREFGLLVDRELQDVQIVEYQR